MGLSGESTKEIMAKSNKASAWDADLESLLAPAAQLAIPLNVKEVTTIFIFLTLSNFLSKKNKDTRYQGTWLLFKETLNSYGITGKLFSDKLPEYLSEDLSPGEALRYSKDVNDVFDVMTELAVKFGKSSSIEDLIRELFSNFGIELFPMMVFILDSENKAIQLYEEMSKAFALPFERHIASLESIKLLTNLNAYVANKNFKIVGADQSVKQIELALMGKTIRNAILVGLAGTGKTASVYEFVRQINAGNTIDELKDKVVYQLEPGALVAGTRYRGDFEERTMNLINALVAEPNAILFIDEAHQMLTLGDGEGGSNAANILKPFITRGDVQMIWATTNDEFNKTINTDKALARRFHKVNISEPTPAQTLEILMGILPGLETHYSRTAPEGLLPKIIEMADKYNIEQANPAKSINLLELAFVNSKVFNETSKIVNDSDLIQSIQLKYGISVSENKTSDTITELSSFILGQEEPLNKIAENLKYIEKGFVDSNKPLISMIFAGPTGVGKTETAKIIAKYFCGSENYLIKLNMGEFTHKEDINKIIGSPIGYIGSNEQSGLVRSIRQYPNSVVLFDEAEKAHPVIFDSILNILDTGEMSDNYGNRISFRSAIIILTSNLGFGAQYENVDSSAWHVSENERVLDAIKGHFRPEFINRLDDIIYFNRLSNRVADMLIERYRKDYVSLLDANQPIEFSAQDIQEIQSMANIKEYGARGLKRAVRKKLLALLEHREGDLRTSLSAKKLLHDEE